MISSFFPRRHVPTEEQVQEIPEEPRATAEREESQDNILGSESDQTEDSEDNIRDLSLLGSESEQSRSFPHHDQYGIEKKKNFIKLCREYRRSEENTQVWDKIREELQALRDCDDEAQNLSKRVAKYQDEENNCTPLHYICKGKPPIGVVEFLLDVSTKPLMMKDKEGNIPLHYAAKHGASYHVVKAIAHADATQTTICEKNNAGQIPLLNAEMSNAPSKVLELLKKEPKRLTPDLLQQFETDKATIEEFSSKSQKFLDLCSRGNPDINVVETELENLKNDENNPQLAAWVAVRIDDDEETPLHIVCSRFDRPYELVKLLVEVSQAPLQMQNNWGGLPLHYAALRGASDDVIKFLCTKYPAATQIKDDYGRLPLHHAVNNGANVSVIDILLEKNPEACSAQDVNGLLPLHLALTRGDNEVINTLVTQNQASRHVRDNRGRLPFDIAKQNQLPPVVRRRVSNEDLTGTSTAEKFLQLCNAYNRVELERVSSLERQVTVDAEKIRQVVWEDVELEIKKLTQDHRALKEVASYRGANGNTPLHIVCMNQPPAELVNLMIVNFSMAPLCQIKNDDGWIPLHVAIRYGAAHDVVQVLLDASPETINVKNKIGQLPFQMAGSLKSSPSVIRILYDSDRIKSAELEDVSQRASDFRRKCAAARDENKQNGKCNDKSETWNSVRTIAEGLKKEPGIAKQVAEAVDDESGMTPLHIVCGSLEPPVDVVKLIIGMSNVALRRRDEREDLPFDIALKRNASDKVLKLLLEAHPQDTKKEDFRDLGFHTIRTVLTANGSSEVIRPLSDASPIPFNKDAILFLEKLDVYSDEHSTSIRTTRSDQGEDHKGGASEEVIAVSERNMGVLIDSFLSEYQPMLQDEEELISHTFRFIRYISNNLKKKALSHQSFNGMLEDRISRRFFTFILSLDLIVHAIIIIAFHHAANASIIRERNSDQDQKDYNLRVADWELVVLSLGIFYLFIREVVQIIGYDFDKLWVWFKDMFNLVDIAYIILLVASTVKIGSAPKDESDSRYFDAPPRGVQTLVMVTGGLAWIMLLLQLKSTYIEFSVFVIGVVHVVKKLFPFLITSVIILCSFAFMYYIDSRYNSDECKDESYIDSNETNFCTFRSSMLKVYTMVVSMEANDFTEYSTWLSVIFAFLFIVILLNVLIAIVNENWENVRRKGERVFWRARYDFVNEVDAIVALVNHCRGKEKNDRVEGNLASVPSWREFPRRICGGIKYALMLIAGFLTLGLLWDEDTRKNIWSKRLDDTSEDDTANHKTQREEMEERFAEMGEKMASQKKQLDDIQRLLFHLSAKLDQQEGIKN